MKAFRILVFLCLFSPFCKGQDYVPLVRDSAVWAENWTTADAGTIFNSGVSVYLLDGDSIFDGVEYSTLWTLDCASYDSDCRSFLGFIREEDKRIYYRGTPYSWDEETFLYDFNYYLSGDSVIYDGPDSLDVFDVTGIFSFELANGEIRKALEIEEWLVVVEGIGFIHQRGILNYWGNYDSGANLICHSVGNNYFYGNEDASSVESCFDPGVIGIREEHFINTQVIPNPSKGTFRLNLFQEYPKLEIRILDINGKEIYSYHSLSESRININFESAPGIYLMQIFSEGNLIGMEKVMRY